MSDRSLSSAMSCQALALLTQGRYTDAIMALKYILRHVPSQLQSTETNNMLTQTFVIRSIDLDCSNSNSNSIESGHMTNPGGSPIVSYFNCAFELGYDDVGTDVDLVALSVTTLFNMALAFHKCATAHGKSGTYIKALQLYSTVCQVIQSADNKEEFLPILLACHFNKMRIHSDFFSDLAHAKSEQTLLQHIISMHKELVHTNEMVRDMISMMYFFVVSDDVMGAAAA
jgi:hypothetical protein